MIDSVSSISFRGDAAPAANQDLISSPGKYTTNTAPATPDTFQKEGVETAEEKKKSKLPTVLATTAALLAAAYIGLGVAVGKGNWEKAIAKNGEDLGIMDKAKNFLHSVGENALNMWRKVRGGEPKAKDELLDLLDDTVEAEAKAN